MPYKPSNIGEQVSTPAQISERNSFKIFEGQEYEMPAIDFDKVGVNTIHAKDRTLIENINYGDPDAIMGQISPGKRVSYGTPEQAEWLSPVISYGHVLANRVFTRSITFPIAEDLSTSPTPSAANGIYGVPQTIDLVLTRSGNLPGNILHIMRTPLLGTATLHHRKTTIPVAYKAALTMSFCPSFIAANGSEVLFQQPNIVNPGYDTHKQGIAVPSPYTCYLGLNSELVPGSVYPNRKARAVGLFSVVNFLVFNSISIRYRIIPVTALVQNSTSQTMLSTSETRLSGKQHFIAIPEAVTVLGGSSSVSTNNSVIHTEDRWVERNYSGVYKLKHKQLFTIGETEIHCITGMEHQASQYMYLYAVRDGVPILPEDKSGLLYFPEGGDFILPNVVPVKIVSMSDSIGVGNSQYLLELEVNGKPLVASISISSASYIFPSGYGNKALVPVDPNVLCVAYLEYDREELSNPVPAFKTSPNQCSSFDTTNKTLIRWQSNLPVKSILASVLYAGNTVNISQSFAMDIEANYGNPSFVFSTGSFSASHAESYGVSSQYHEVTTIPVLYPGLHIFPSAVLSLQGVSLLSGNTWPSVKSLETLERSLDFACMFPGSSLADYIAATDPAPITGSGEISKTWCNCINVEYSYNNTDITLTPVMSTGTIFIVNAPAVDRAGTPMQVMFSQDVLGAEFINSKLVHGTRLVETMAGSYVSSNNKLYTGSVLYPLSSVENNRIHVYGKARRGFFGLSQFVFASDLSTTTIYAQDNTGIYRVSTIPGYAVDSPAMLLTGLVFCAIEPQALVLYSLFEGAATPIKRIAYSGRIEAYLKQIDNIGLCLAVHNNAVFRLYLIRDKGVVLIGQRAGVSSIGYYEADNSCNISVVEQESSSSSLLIGLEPNGKFDIYSSEFYFPLIEGLKPVLVGMKLSFDDQPNKKFNLFVKANGKYIHWMIDAACAVENIIVFNTQLPVGQASYMITDCTGTLRNVQWVFSPMPIVQETINVPTLIPVYVDKQATKVIFSLDNIGPTAAVRVATDKTASACLDDFNGTVIHSVGGSYDIEIPIDGKIVSHGTELHCFVDPIIDPGETELSDGYASCYIDYEPPDKPILKVEEDVFTEPLGRLLTIESIPVHGHAIISFKADGYSEVKLTAYSESFYVNFARIGLAQKDLTTLTIDAFAVIVSNGVESAPSDTIQIELSLA